MNADRIMKARDLAPGDVVEMPLDRTLEQVEIAEARKGNNYGGIPAVFVHGVTATGVLVDITFSPESTFRFVRRTYD